jgi:hypothetical protein
MNELKELTNSLLLAFAVLLLVSIVLVVWATVMFFQVQNALDRLHRTLHPRVPRDGQGRLIKERL